MANEEPVADAGNSVYKVDALSRPELSAALGVAAISSGSPGAGVHGSRSGSPS